MKEENVWREIAHISSKILEIYEELNELSYKIEYIHVNGNAGDDLKILAGELMNEIQRLYPHNY